MLFRWSSTQFLAIKTVASGEAVERYGTTSEWMGPVTALAGLKVPVVVPLW